MAFIVLQSSISLCFSGLFGLAGCCYLFSEWSRDSLLLRRLLVPPSVREKLVPSAVCVLWRWQVLCCQYLGEIYNKALPVGTPVLPVSQNMLSTSVTDYHCGHQKVSETSVTDYHCGCQKVSETSVTDYHCGHQKVSETSVTDYHCGHQKVSETSVTEYHCGRQKVSETSVTDYHCGRQKVSETSVTDYHCGRQKVSECYCMPAALHTLYTPMQSCTRHGNFSVDKRDCCPSDEADSEKECLF